MKILWISDNKLEMLDYQFYFFYKYLEGLNFQIFYIIGFEESFQYIKREDDYDIIITTHMKYLGFWKEYEYKEYKKEIKEFLKLVDKYYPKIPIVFTTHERIEIMQKYLGKGKNGNYHCVDLGFMEEQITPFGLFFHIYNILIEYYSDEQMEDTSEPYIQGIDYTIRLDF